MKQIPTLQELMPPSAAQRQRLSMPFSQFLNLNLSDGLMQPAFSDLFVRSPVLSICDDYAMLCQGGEL